VSFAPAKTPSAAVAKINAAVVAAINGPEVSRKLIDSGAVPTTGTPAQLAHFLKSELARWAR
jgi:tripartite-type tricarboxylate transporter receptor subunit TctC